MSILKTRKGEVKEYNIDNSILSCLDKYKTKNNTLLSKSTVNAYKQKLQRLAILATGEPLTNISFLKENPNKVIEAIENSNFKSKKDFLTATIVFLKCKKVKEEIINKYSEALLKFKNLETEERGNNKAKETDIKKALSLNEIITRLRDYNIYDENKKLNFNKLINKLIVSFYFDSYLVPRNDLPDFKIENINNDNLDNNYNYILLKNGKPNKIVMLNYKTAKTYGKQSFNLTDNLKRLLEIYIKRFNKKIGDFLFVDRNNNKFTTNNFSHLIKSATEEIFGKGHDMGVDLMRQIIVSNFYKLGLHSINEIKEFSRSLLHSENTGKEYVRVDLPQR